jgi:hypothetical protein
MSSELVKFARSGAGFRIRDQADFGGTGSFMTFDGARAEFASVVVTSPSASKVELFSTRGDPAGNRRKARPAPDQSVHHPCLLPSTRLVGLQRLRIPTAVHGTGYPFGLFTRHWFGRACWSKSCRIYGAGPTTRAGEYRGWLRGALISKPLSGVAAACVWGGGKSR